MLLRRARPEDLEAVGEVTVEAYAAFTAGAEDGYVTHLRDAATRHREAELWVALTDDDTTVVGSVTVCPEGSPWREIAEPGEGEFRMLSVAPGARGLGVGTALVELVVAHFREEGARAVALSSLAEMSAAHRLYDRAGFVRLPERDWSPVEGVDLIAFRLDLEAR